MTPNNLATDEALVVDPATSICNQPVFSIWPRVTGMADPLPGEVRYGLVESTLFPAWHSRPPGETRCRIQSHSHPPPGSGRQ
jgi:hypothetical protein